MKLSLQIISLFFAGIVLLLVADSFLLVRHDMRVLDRSIRSDASHLGQVYGEMLRHVARTSGPEAAIALVRDLDQEDSQMKCRWVWLDAEEDSPHRPLGEMAALDRVAEGETLSLRLPMRDEPDVLAVYVPLDLGSGRPGALELSESLAPAHAYRRTIIKRSVILLAATTVLGLLLSWLIFVPMVGRPLSRMVAKTERIGAGDFTCDLDLPGRAELSDLAVAMNRMCVQLDAAGESLRAETEARIKALEQLRHSERLAVVGRISSGLAHELGTPLNVVSGRAKMIGSGELTTDEVNDSARIIREQSERMTGIIRQLLDFARRPQGDRHTQPLAPVINGVLRMLEPTARKTGVSLAAVLPEEVPPVNCDRAQVEQVLLNLVMNAIQAMPDGGMVTVGLSAEQDPGAPDGSGFLVLTVGDDGPGIDEAHRRQIFEPFYTTKGAGKGTGLGLPIVQGIVEEYGGTIAVDSGPDRGTTFTIHLPAGDSA